MEILLKYIDANIIYRSLHDVSPGKICPFRHQKYTPLTAASTSNIELMKYLDNMKFDFDKTDRAQRTPIMTAKCAGRSDIEDFLKKRKQKSNNQTELHEILLSVVQFYIFNYLLLKKLASRCN